MTVGDKMCRVRSARPMLLPTATIDGAKVADKLLTNVTVGDKTCRVRSARPMLLTTATVDGAKITADCDGRRRQILVD